MKTMLSGVAAFVLILILLVFQIDNYSYRLNSIFLKYCADEASSSASVFYDLEKYSLGKKIFNEEEGIKSIENVIHVYLVTDRNLNPLSGSYWSDKITYKVYFFDDDLNCRVYEDGSYVRSFDFLYPYLYTDEELLYKKSISKPTIVVTINAGKADYRMNFKDIPNCIRSSAYEYIN